MHKMFRKSSLFRAKKHAALFMAILILLQFTPFHLRPGSESVYAASGLDFSFNLHETLVSGNIYDTPVISDTGNSSNEVLIQWNLTNSSNSNQFLFHTVLTDNRELFVLVTKEEQGNVPVVSVQYGIGTDPRGTGLGGDPADSINSNLSLPTVFTYSEIDGKSQSYVNYESYRQEHDYTGNPDYTEVQLKELNSGELPTFYLPDVQGVNHGLLTEYGNMKINFLIENGVFYISINEIGQNTIYDVNLYHSPNNNNDMNGMLTAPNDNIVLYRGLTIKESKPFAKKDVNSDDRGYVEDILYLDDDDYCDPATDPNGIRISFEFPKRWDGTEGKFNPLPVTPIGDDPLYSMYVELSLRDKSNASNYISMPIDNIFESATLITGDVAVTAELIHESNNGSTEGVLYIEGLPAGTIFSTTMRADNLIDKTTNQNITNEMRTTTDLYSAYTFLNFDIMPLNNEYHALITPYKQAGIYKIYMGLPNGSNASELIAEGEVGESGDPFLLPLLLKGATLNGRLFQIVFEPNEIDASEYRSQKVVYKSNPDDFLIVSPDDLVLLDYTLKELPEDDSNYGTQAELTMQLSWNIARLDNLKKWLQNNGNTGTLYYNLFEKLSPVSPLNRPEQFERLKAEFTLNGNGTIDVTYEGVPLNSEHEPHIVKQTLTNIGNGLNGTEMVKTDITIKTRAGNLESGSSGGNNIYFFYPGIYFLHVEREADDEEISSKSNDVSMTLDLPQSFIPAAENLIAANPVTTTKDVSGAASDRVSFDVQWNIPYYALKEFLDKYVYENEKLTYNLYISENEEDLKSLTANSKIAGTTYADAIKNNPIDTNGMQVINTLYFSDINGIEGFSVQNYNNARDALRNGEIVCVEGIEIDNLDITSYKMTLDGLDKNRKYYVVVKSVLAFTASYTDLNNEQLKSDVVKESMLSNIASITTADDNTTPTPDDETPKSPDVVWDEPLTTSTSATVYWDRILNLDANFNEITTDTYEIIRLTQKMDDEYINKRVGRDEFLQGFNLPEYLWLQSDYDYGVAYEFDRTETRIHLKDNTLKPNKVYFYYVRTVQTDSNGQKRYSSWDYEPVTTRVVDKPLNLNILRDENHPYDAKTEFWIEFDANIGTLDKLGADYNLQYLIRLNDGSWSASIPMNADTLRASATLITDGDLKGYYHFKYKITGLIPNSTYTILVRLVDVTNNEFTDSDSKQTRTDLDQGEYDKEKEIKDTIEYLKGEMADLVKEVVWYAQDTASNTTVVYRPSMFNSVLFESTDGQLPLILSKAATATYYLPGSAIASANEQGKSFVINHGDDMKIIFSNGSLDIVYSDAAIAAKSDINSKKIADYLVRITIHYTNTTDIIDGNSPISDQIEVRVEFVGISKVIDKWDEEILTMFLGKIADGSLIDNAADTLTDMIENNASNEEIVRFINSSIATARQVMMREVNNSLSDMLKTSYSIVQFPQPVILQIKKPTDDAIVKGYEKISNQWQPVDTKDYAGGKAIFANAPGTFIFTGYIINLPGLDGIASEDTMKTLIAKYGLDDYFGKGATFDLNKNVSLYVVTGVVARIAGSDKLADPVQFLKGKGYTVSTRNTQNATAQETLYLIMALYEMKTNTKISALKIRDFTKTADIKGLDSKYIKSVQAAFELGFYSEKEKLPKGSMTAKDILNLLTVIGKKIKL